MNFKIPLSYNPVDADGLKKVLDSYEGKHHNQIVSDFESEIKLRTGSPYVLALNSGTSAIHLALRLLDVGPGDEVITSTFTYVATVNPILYQGAAPVLIDSEKDSWNMDPMLLESAVKDRIGKNRKPKAILVVHCYGMPARMEEILAIANKFEIPVIEDAAEALGSKINGKHVGTLGTVGILSFNNNKAITTYGGGALLCGTDSFFKKAQLWAGHSRENLPYYLHKELGFNYRMGPLNAACGLSQIKDLDERINLRRTSFDRYKAALKTYDLGFAEERKGDFSNRWITTVLMNNEQDQFTVAGQLFEKAIEARPVWNPMHKQPLFRDYPSYNSGVSEKLFLLGICLPSNSSVQEIDYVLSNLTACLK